MENGIFDGNSTGADLTKNSENFVLSEIVLRNYFLSKFFIPLIKGKVSTKFEAIFRKIEFLTEIRQARNLAKIVKILYYLKLC